MKRLLIVNLKRFGDIFATSHLIQNLKSESPHYEIGIVVYKEFERAAHCLAGISQVYTIDRHRLSLLVKKSIFNNSIALDELYELLFDIESDHWDTVLNYSNDEIATRVTSFLSSNSKSDYIGIRYRDNDAIEYSSEWSLIFNDVISEYPYTPIHFKDIYNDICLTTNSTVQNPLIKNKKYDEVAKTNFDHLRSLGDNSKNAVPIVGLQLTTSDPEKSIPKEILTQFITLVEHSKKFKLVLLIAPTDSDRNYVNQINQEFNNGLVVVEADFKALISVVNEMDYLVTPDTAIKHIADLYKKPLLEISLGKVSFRKQGTTTPGNIIFRPITADGRKMHSMTGKDIFCGLESLKNPEALQLKTFSEDLKIYTVSQSANGIVYTPSTGLFNAREELNAHSLNIFFARYWSQVPANISMEILNTFTISEISRWCGEEKEAISTFSKLLLKTLRSLIQAKEHLKYSATFIEALDKLLATAKSSNLTGALVLITRGRLESNLKGSTSENHITTEKALYELKGMVQQINTILNEIESISKRTEIIRKSTFNQRSISF